MTTRRTVLILCTGNSCRSQMAEALWNELGGGAWEAQSAGSYPTGEVHPLAVRVMEEMGIDLSSHRSKSVDEFRDRSFHLVVTVCDRAKESCPVVPSDGATLHWPFDDPAEAQGSEAERLAAFRKVRDAIRDRIARFLEGESRVMR